MWGWTRRHGALLVVALAFVLRLSSVALVSAPPANDELEYLDLAKSIATGYGYQYSRPHQWDEAYRAPLYPLFVSAFVRLAGEGLAWIRISQVFLGTLTVWLCIRAACLLTGRSWIGIVVGMGAALHAPNIVLCAHILTETLFAFLLVLAFMLFCLWARRPTFGKAVITGCALGLAILTRSNLLPFLLLLPCLPLVAFRWRRRAARGARRQLLAIPVLAAVVIAPWCIRSSLHYGQLMLVTNAGGELLWRGNNPSTGKILADPGFDRGEAYRRMLEDHGSPETPEGRDRAALAEVLGYWSAHPIDAVLLKLEMAGHILKVWPSFAERNQVEVNSAGNSFAVDVRWAKLMWYVMMDLFMVLSLASFPDSFREAGAAFGWLLLATALIVGIVFFADLRHRYPYDYIILVLAGIGLMGLSSRINAKVSHAVLGR